MRASSIVYGCSTQVLSIVKSLHRRAKVFLHYFIWLAVIEVLERPALDGAVPLLRDYGVRTSFGERWGSGIGLDDGKERGAAERTAE